MNLSNQIFNEDCLAGMSRLPDGCVDMILCDLPYGTAECKWDTVIPFAPLWEQYGRLIKGNGAIVLFCSQPFTTALGASKLEWLKYAWVWEKSNAGDCMNVKNKPMKKHEDILVFTRGTIANRSPRRMPYFPQGLVACQKARRGTDYSPNEDRAFRTNRPSHKAAYTQEFSNYPTDILRFANEKPALHPTQKPTALAEYLVRTYTQEGELVLDNCMGSGTTAVACIRTGRRFVGFEKDPRYYKIAVNRIAETTSPGPLR